MIKTKPKPITFLKEDKVSQAIEIMSEKNYGSVVIVDEKENHGVNKNVRQHKNPMRMWGKERTG